jgi:cytochrome c biogenesis protein ResB
MKQEIIKILSSPKLFVYCLVWLMVLVVVGTVSQRDIGLFASQQRYFSSYIFLFGPIPLPGGRIVLALMLTNLISMMFKQNMWKMKKIGILIVHLGGIMLLFGAGLTAIFSSEGSMVIEEGSRSNTVDDYHNTELAIINISEENYDIYTVFDQALFVSGNNLRHENLNFDITILEYMDNSTIEPIAGQSDIQYRGMLKNFSLKEISIDKDDMKNRPGIIFQVSGSFTDSDGIYGLIFGQSVPATLSINGKQYVMSIQKKKTYLPFAIELLDFKKVLHPGTQVAKSYSSRINLIEDNVPRSVLIEMNKPLRHKGYTFFQASFIEGPDGEATVLAAVHNYGRLFPYISSIIMSIGLLLHLLTNLPSLLKKNRK